MPQSNGRFSKNIISALVIVQILLSTLLPQAAAGVIKKREIPAPNDPDIVIIGDDDSTRSKMSADVVGGGLPKNESENMASTKLLPQVSGGDSSMEDFKSSLKSNIDRVEEKSQLEPLENVSIKKVESEESILKHTIKNESLPLTTTASSNLEHQETTETLVFSHLTAATDMHNETTNVINNVNDGLDNLAMQMEDDLTSNVNTTMSPSTTVPTTEEILREVENTALKVPQANLTTTNAANKSSSVLLGPSKSDFGRSMLHSEEDIFRNALEVTTIVPEAIAVKLYEPTRPAHFMETTTTIATDSDRIETTTVHALTLPDLIMATTTAAPSMHSQNAGVEQLQPLETTSATLLATTTTLLPHMLPQVDNASLAQHSHENAVEESNEIRAPAINPNGQSSSEKRGKFIDDNSTNAQQLNLPDGAEVWTLAGMKTVPKTNVTMTKTELATEKKNVEISALSTEKTPNSNSEKNLLDWTQIMKNGDLDSKKYDNLVEPGVIMTKKETNSSVVDNNKPAVTNEISDMQSKSNESFENRTEVLINSTVDTTDKTAEPVTMVATATNSLNEASTEATTAGISHELVNIKPDLPATIAPTTTVAPIIADNANVHLTPYATRNESNTDSPPVDLSSSTLVNLVKADISTTTNATLSTDNSDSDVGGGSNASEVPKENLQQSVVTTTATLNSNDIIESELLEETTAATPLPISTSTLTTTTAKSTDEHDGATTEALPEIHAATMRLAPPSLVASNASNNEVTLNANKNNNNDDVGSVGVGGRDEDDANDRGDAATLELSSSETTTLSTLKASEVNTTNAADGGNFTNLTTAHSEILQNEKDFWETTTATTTATAATITTTTTTVLPIILTTTTNTNTATTTEVGQIGNEVDLDIKTEQIIGSSTSPAHSDANDETTTKTTTTSSTNDSLLLITELATTTTAPVITTTAAAATTATPIQVSSSTTGSVSAVVDSPTEATPAAVVDVETGNSKVKPATNGAASHESESSIETNVIDPLDKSTKSSDKENKKDTNDAKEAQPKIVAETTQSEHKNDEDILLTQATTTTMETFILSTTTSTTTEPPLISLLDDSTTTTPSMPVVTNGTKIEEVYSVFPSTTTTESVTINYTAAPPTPNTTTSATLVPKIEEVSAAVSTTTTTTTMLPPTASNVLHASIGGGVGGMTAAPALMPPGDMGSGNLNVNSADASGGGGGTDVNVIIAISVSVIGVVALILLVAFLYLMRKRQKQMSYGQRCRPVSLDAYSLDNVSVLGSVRRNKGAALRASKRSYGNVAFDDPSLRHNLLSASELGRFVERRSSIFEEFRDVPQIIARADEGCEDKNRYANVIPLPETRVILQQQNDDEKTEYINANYVRGPKDAPNYYIACQAPIDLTVADFWRMIWEQQSRVIIQATDLIENGIEKCAEYLPPSVTLDNHTTYGDFQVTLKHREVKDKYAISTLMLRNTITETSRELTHYWYKWPETGVPGEEAPLIAMLLEARSSLKSYAIEQANELKAEKSSTLTLKVDDVTSTDADADKSDESMEKKDANSVSGGSNSGSAGSSRAAAAAEINGNVSTEKLKAAARNQGPLTIHCSPGTGRTGTIISCDMAIRSLETPKRSVDIPQIVYYVRRGRASAVQTKEQYEFIYKVTNMYATKITNISNDN